MASDIPETHANPDAMARCLASYIADPDKIFRRVHAEFGTSPCHGTIAAMRRLHLKPPQPVEPWKPYDGYYPNDVAGSLARINAAFVARLEAERVISAATRNKLATVTDFADRRWDADILTARLASEVKEPGVKDFAPKLPKPGADAVGGLPPEQSEAA